MFKQMIIITLLIMASSVVCAQPFDQPFLNRGQNNQSLFNPNNLNMNHSMSFMSSISSDGSGYYQSVYTNHLFYRFNPKLDMKLDLNFVNHGTANWDNSFSINSNNDNTNTVIPEFSLNYRPTANTRITIEYRQYGLPASNSNWRW